MLPHCPAGQRPCRRRWAATAWLAVAAVLGGLLVIAPGTAGPVGAAQPERGDAGEEDEAPLPSPRTAASRGSLDLPASQVEALANAWKKVDSLAEQVDRRGVVRDFGKRAEAIIKSAVEEAEVSGTNARSMEEILDAPLMALFRRQVQTLVARSADLYDSEVARRPNPLEAAKAAEQAFLTGAEALVREGSGWEYEAEHRDLLALVAESYDRDAQLVDDQAKTGRGKQITIEVIKKLQEQQAAVQREVETRGAFPWNVRWQYMVENSPVGFRGQYAQGRSVVELLLMPSPDPRYKKNLLNRIGPLNLAVAFDMLL